MARDPDTGEDGCREVTALHRRGVKEVYRLELTDEHGVVQVDHVTGEHPYKVADGEFVAVDLLEPGVVLEGYEGLLKLTGKTLVQGDFLVYNLSVEGVETFFVGGVGSWVHNCDDFVTLYHGSRDWTGDAFNLGEVVRGVRHGTPEAGIYLTDDLSRAVTQYGRGGHVVKTTVPADFAESIFRMGGPNGNQPEFFVNTAEGVDVLNRHVHVVDWRTACKRSAGPIG